MFVNEIHQGGIRALLDYDNTIFDNMVVPEDVTLADVVDHILYKYGDTPLFSPDPSIIKFYIGRWSNRRLPLWERYKAAIEAEYNPIENYDRSENTTTDLTHGHKIVTNDDTTHGHKIVTNDDTTHGHKIVSNDDLTHGLTTENQISADNAATYQPDRKSINSGKDERDMDETHSGKDERDYDETHSGKDERDFDETHSGKDERDFDETHSGKDSTSITGRIHGNIGVTTSQQMLNQEFDIIPRLDLIDYIADDFKAEFCLLMYV